MSWPEFLQGKTIALVSRNENGKPTYLEMFFQRRPGDKGLCDGDCEGILKHVAHGLCSNGSLVVVFQWTDMEGFAGIQTMWLKDKDFHRCRGAFLTFERDPLGQERPIQIGAIKEYIGSVH